LGLEGEAELAKSGVTVRCLVMPDGSLPASDSADGALAIVSRAY
jgi:prolyl-tRNA synthetase